MEFWVRTNRRAFAVASVLPAVLLLAGLWLMLADSSQWIMQTIGGAAIIAGLAILGMLVYVARLPRLAYSNDVLLVYLSSLAPVKVPIEFVECFFLGQGPAHVLDRIGHKVEASNIVVRLAEAARKWHQVEVKPALGKWCDGYITIHGTWCEPIDSDFIKQLNSRLVQVKRELGAKQKAPSR